MRRDIQFLRGIAVLAVVAYHAELFALNNGFLGVDVFFVISGFLITTLILRGLDQSDFSFAEFYLRRARRLLPALYSTLLVVTVAAYVFLTQRQWDDYLNQLLGAVTFTANMVLPYQVGYFDDAAQTRPLLHIWSLSLEEQYYFIMPALLVLTARRWRVAVLSVLTVASLALCIGLLGSTVTFADLESTELAFYLFPARAWELLAGSLLACLMLHYPALSVPRPFKWALAISLLALLFFPLDSEHPRGDAILAVALTALLIVGRDDWLPNFAPLRWVEKVGDWSYSLYLIHWPLLAFAYVAFLGAVPQNVRIGLVVSAFILAWLQYRFVETPFRRARTSRARTVGGLLLGTLCILLIALPAATVSWGLREASGPNFEELRRKNVGLHGICALKPPYRIPGRCKTTPQPKVAVWGDSYAMHLIPGLRENPATGDSIFQLTRSGCSPALRLVPIITTLTRARQCRDFNARALELITTTASVEYVVMSSPFGYFFNAWKRVLLGEEVVPYARGLVIQDVVAAIRTIQRAGKTVLIVSPPPHAGFDVGECIERRATGALVLGRSDCDIGLKGHLSRQRLVISGLEKVSEKSDARILWLSSLMCAGDVCATTRDGVPLYRDSGHLSIEGSRRVLGGATLWWQLR
ncbi:acyltransferase [Gammaproteobacteria bacterium]|nr:acyltransferase [Gammaproteobacteria bacterium]